MIIFTCNNPKCDNSIEKYYTKVSGVPPFLDCGACGSGKLEQQLGAPQSHKTQTLDNGLQARPVELRDVIMEKEQDRRRNDET
jgi:hypothetical protein